MSNDPASNASASNASGKRDPMKMANQPALQASSGRIWLVVGAIFAASSLLPLALLIFAGSGKSTGVATVVAGLVILCFVLIVVARLVVKPGPIRLRWMAAGLLSMAAIALIGMWICAEIERIPG